MARAIASRWLDTHAHAEHRLTVYYTGRDGRGMPNLMRSLRDGKVKLGSVGSIPDLGVQEAFDSLTVWSGDRVALSRLASWFEERGYDTSGAWE